MKKFLLSALAAFAGVSMVVAGETTFTFTGTEDVYGLTRYSQEHPDYNPNLYIADSTRISDGNITITLIGNNGFRLWTDGLRFYKGSTMEITSSNENITDIEISAKANLSLALPEGQPGSFSVDAKTGSWTGDAATVSLAATQTKGNVALLTIKVTTGGVADTRKDAAIAFPETEYTVTLGETFASPVATKATTAELTYSSSADEIASVNPATGEVEILAAGTAVITAKAEANDEFKAGEASYTLIVKDGSTVYSGLTESLAGWAVEDGTLPEGLTYVWSWDTRYNCAKASGYYKKAFETKASLTSPEIDLADLKEISLDFELAGNYFTEIAKECSVLMSVDGGAFEAIEIANWPTNFTFVPNTVDLNAYAGKKIKVQFLYTSTAEAAGTLEVKNFIVKGKKNTSGIEGIEAVTDNAPVEYFNLQGVRVDNPAAGLFIRRQGNKVTKVIIR